MSNTILAEWQSTHETNTTAIIIPDGCRDLIMRIAPGGKPHWFISSLEDHTYAVSIKMGEVLKGYRLKPGARIDKEGLLASVQDRHFETTDLCEQINDFSFLSPSTVEALDCLACNQTTVAKTAIELGVSQRSLQRLFIQETGRSPVYWMSLARVRKSARTVLTSLPLAEIAALHGYADQAHMSREFKRWLNISPSRLQEDRKVCDQLNAAGYA